MKLETRNSKLEEVFIRAAIDAITRKRRTRRTLILLTGGTGFLGSHIASDLLGKGFRVCMLARRRSHLPAAERVRRLFDWLGVEPNARRRLEVLEGDLDADGLGLEAAAYLRLTAEVDEIIHCASATAFSERKRRQVEKANVENLGRLLDFASGSRCFFLHLVSTAYVAGCRDAACPEALVEADTFTNVYEETKHRAEKLADKRCGEAGIRLSIYRPSIVYGHSRTGKTLRFNAVYYPVRTLSFLRDLYERDVRERGGKGARKLGVFFDRDGYAHLPIRIEASDAGGINLIPVDFFTEAFTAVMEEALDGGVFHIVNPAPKPAADLVDYAQRFFRIKGVRAVSPGALAAAPVTGLEALFNRFIEAYRPYLKDGRTFETRRAEAVLNGRRIRCPEFDYTVFSRCMRYAVSTDWGRQPSGKGGRNG